MRLGDLDALYDCVEARYRLSSGEEHKAERTLLDAICGSPTIPAISVEWLEKRRQNLILAAMVHSTVYGDNSVELCHAVNVVLDMWQKEQEAR